MTEQERKPLTDAERFTAHLEESRRIVASWPEWKRNVLGKLSEDHMETEERKPRTIERTLAEGDSIEFINVDVLSVAVKKRPNHAGQVRIVATVIDKQPKIA